MKIVSLLVLLSFTAFAQDDLKQKLSESFPKSYCECLNQRIPSKKAFDFMQECLWSFLTSYEAEIVSLSGQVKDSISDYEKGKMLGLETIYKTIPNLVKSCDGFKATLVEYKETSMARMNVTKESAKNAISNMVARKADVPDVGKLSTYYIFLGMMHELNGDLVAANESYEESIKVNPNIIAKGLQSLLSISK